MHFSFNHLYHFFNPYFLPLSETGRINIQLTVEIPKDTELVEPVQDGCIWRLARGAAAEVSGAEDLVSASEKVQTVQIISLILLDFFYSPFDILLEPF